MNVNEQILSGGFKGIIIPGKEKQKGIWIGRNTKINAQVVMEPPLVIGNNCTLLHSVSLRGKTIIGNNVLIDQNSSVEKSIIFDNTLISSHTDVKNSLIRKNHLVNISRHVDICLEDDFIIGDLEKKIIIPKAKRIFNLIIALIFSALFSPILLLLFGYHFLVPSKKYFSGEKRFGGYDVSGRPEMFFLYVFHSKNHFIQKLPGLFNVIKGDLCLVGNTPLTDRQVSSLKENWETLRFKTPAGLFSFWEGEKKKNLTWDERIVTETYYSMTRTFWGDCKILFKNLFLF